MRRSACLVVALLLVGLAATGDDQPGQTPPTMSLRLELFVSDLEKSSDFYTQVLGFERLKAEAEYVPVRSGSVLIGLSQAAALGRKHYFNPEIQTSRRGLGTEIVLEVDDVQALFAKVNAADRQRILSPVRKQPWGLSDFRVADPDGYYLRITSR